MATIVIIVIVAFGFTLLLTTTRPANDPPNIYVYPTETRRGTGCFPGVVMFVLGVVLTLVFVGEIAIR